MSNAVVVERRFRGPPHSVNGGYACGVTAAPLGRRPIEVTLRRPPPIERTLALDVEGDEARLRDGDTLIAVARPADVDIDGPAAVPFAAAVAAAEAFDFAGYRSNHEFPECFVCGPDRAEGDGLRIHSAPSDRPGLHVWPWIPAAGLFDDGEIDAALVWAALDCPGGLAVLADDTVGPAVLGQLVGIVARRPEPDERLVVAGWAGERSGRKIQAGTAIWSETGEVLAAGRALWIELTADQRRAFGGISSGG